MDAKTKNKIIEYLVLVLILSTGFYSILILKDNHLMQFFSIIVMSFLYIIWGIAKHFKENTFHFKIVVEYSLLAILVAVVLIIILSLS